MQVKNEEIEAKLRTILFEQGFSLLIEQRQNGENGVDILVEKDGKKYGVEVIGYKKSGPARSKDFFQCFFRAISRIKDGVQHCVIASSYDWRVGLPMRIRQYGIAWKRIGDAFPELEIWFVDFKKNELIKKKWNDWECIFIGKYESISIVGSS